MAKTILVVDDKASVRTLVRDYLAQEGFGVVTAENGREALYAARHEKPDLILLDIMMPEMGGYEFLRAYRKERNTPVILLTARIEESDKVLGLELGADDYVTKPFGMRELVARIRAVLRRSLPEEETPQDLQFDTLHISFVRHEVRVNGRAVNLTPTEFRLLETLAREPGRAFSRADLLDRAFGYDYEGLERTVDVHVMNLRRKIEAEPTSPRYVITVPGLGYRFEGRRDEIPG